MANMAARWVADKSTTYAYADDTILLTNHRRVYEREELVNDSKVSNMVFHAKKTKIMAAGQQNMRVNLHRQKANGYRTGEEVSVPQFAFYRAAAMQTRYSYEHLSVRPSVCLSNEWIVTKRKHLAKKVQL